MAFHICSVVYKTNLADETVSQMMKDVLAVFTETHVYEFSPSVGRTGYTIEELSGQQVGFVSIFSQLVQFYVYVMGGPETLADAHALETEMIGLMESVFAGHERAPASLLAPLP